MILGRWDAEGSYTHLYDRVTSSKLTERSEAIVSIERDSFRVITFPEGSYIISFRITESVGSVHSEKGVLKLLHKDTPPEWTEKEIFRYAPWATHEVAIMKDIHGKDTDITLRILEDVRDFELKSRKVVACYIMEDAGSNQIPAFFENTSVEPVFKLIARLHALDIAHGDCHYKNIVLTQGGCYRLIDFGCAHHNATEEQKRNDIETFIHSIRHGLRIKENHRNKEVDRLVAMYPSDDTNTIAGEISVLLGQEIEINKNSRRGRGSKSLF